MSNTNEEKKKVVAYIDAANIILSAKRAQVEREKAPANT